MALFSMKLENLQQLYLKELRDLYDAENQITGALPKLIDAANNSELKNALQEHLNVTQTQIKRLEQIFQTLNEKATGETCKGMKGVIKEGDEIVSAGGDPSTVDAGTSALLSASSTTKWLVTARFATMPSCSARRSTAGFYSKRWMRKRKQIRRLLKLPAPSTLRPKQRKPFVCPRSSKVTGTLFLYPRKNAIHSSSDFVISSATNQFH